MEFRQSRGLKDLVFMVGRGYAGWQGGSVITYFMQSGYSPESPSDMTGHGNLVVVNIADYALPVDHISYPGGAQHESSLHIVQPPYPPGSIATQGKGYAIGVGKSLQPADIVGADANDDSAQVPKFRLRVSKLPGLDRSTKSECSQEEIEDNVLATMVRQGKILP